MLGGIKTCCDTLNAATEIDIRALGGFSFDLNVSKIPCTIGYENCKLFTHHSILDKHYITYHVL